ncbi:MAG: CoA-transferase subunit beta [Desulfobaccales bacterium]
MTAPYTEKEMMALAAGRLVTDGDVLFAGAGVALLASSAARLIHAPSSVLFVETGGIDPSLEELPLAVADPRVMVGTCINSGLVDAFSLLAHRRLRTIAFLGAAQIDAYGNINSTCLGDYHKPNLRFPGCGGACDAMSQAFGTIIFMQQDKKRFVEKVDYISSPGWLTGGDARQRAGFKRGGPQAVVTNLGVMKFDPDTHRMYLSEYYPSVTLEQIALNTGFEMDLSQATESAPPTEHELKVLREEVDPCRLILGT